MRIAVFILAFVAVTLTFKEPVINAARVKKIRCGPALPHHDFYDEVQWCDPNAKFYKNCNFCQCNEDGTAAACTNMVCPPLEIGRIDNYYSVRPPKGDPRPRCPPNKSFSDGCNNCGCSEDGSYAGCTRMGCNSDVFEQCDTVFPRNDFFWRSNSCIPGAPFKIWGCILCHCSNDGNSAVCESKELTDCNLKHIKRIDGFKEFNLKCPTGTDNESFWFRTDECNSCVCKRGVATCTDNVCDKN